MIKKQIFGFYLANPDQRIQVTDKLFQKGTPYEDVLLGLRRDQVFGKVFDKQHINGCALILKTKDKMSKKQTKEYEKLQNKIKTTEYEDYGGSARLNIIHTDTVDSLNYLYANGILPDNCTQWVIDGLVVLK